MRRFFIVAGFHAETFLNSFNQTLLYSFQVHDIVAHATKAGNYKKTARTFPLDTKAMSKAGCKEQLCSESGATARAVNHCSAVL